MKIFVLHILFLLLVHTGFAQFHPQQGLYMYNPLPINGAAAGKDNALSMTLSHRSMWQGVPGAPKTQYASVHMPLKKENIAVALQLFNDKIGVSRRTGLFATGAYRLELTRNSKLSFGLTAGVASMHNMWSEIVTTYQGDQVFNDGDMSYWLPNVGASAYYYDKHSFAGISIPTLLTETYSGGGQYKSAHDFGNYSYHLLAGRTFTINRQLFVRPSALVKYHPRSGAQADLSIMGGTKKLGEAGITLRPGQAFVALLKANVNEQFSLAYCFESLSGTLGKYSRGTHEIALMYIFIYQSNAPNTRFF